MPEFDPAVNGHRLGGEELPPLPPRGRGVMLLVMVSGMTALNLVFGSMVGAIIGAAMGLEDRSLQNVFMTGAGVGACAGVWFGIKVGTRFGGTSGLAGQKRLFAYGMAGLLLAMPLAALVASPFIPLIAIMLPGIGAVVGDVLATRPLHAAHAARDEKAWEAEEAAAAEAAEEGSSEEMDRQE